MLVEVNFKKYFGNKENEKKIKKLDILEFIFAMAVLMKNEFHLREKYFQ